MSIGIGIIGAGAISASACKALATHPEAKVVAAHDLNEQRLRELCAEHKIPNSYATAAALLADPAVQGVYIAVPNKFHASLAIQALRAGKHVILDKPFALSLPEAQEVASAASSSGKIFMLGMNQRYRPESQAIRSLAASGYFGEMYHAKAFWIRREGIPRLGTWFGSKELAGGGCLLDIGVHLLDLCLHVTGKWDPVSVYGATYTRFGNRGLGEGTWGKSEKQAIPFDVDDFATALIRFRDGSTVSLDVTWACHDGNRNDVQVFGTEAGAGLYPAKVFRRDPLRQDYDVVEKPRAAVPLAHGCRFHNFVNSILGREQPLTSIAEALTVQAILDAIYQSAASGHEAAVAPSAALSAAR
jgi:predicted dehydrogenase